MNGDSTDAPPEQNGLAPEHGGDDRENDEVEEEQKGPDQFADLRIQKEVGEEELRPKLAEGFYEIEAVRRKRVRKGQVQYLIKWRGWPETANTWEPNENLASCYDVIEAFEESLRSGKHRSRKRKRRSTGPVPQAKKKPQGNAASTSRAPDAGNVKFDEGNYVIPSLDDQNHEDGGRSRIGDINSNEAVEQGNENGSVVVPPPVEKENHYEMDANRGELTDAPFPSEGSSRLPVDILDSEASEVIFFANGHQKVDGEGVVEASGFQNGHQKVDGEGVVKASGFQNGHQKVDGEVVKASGFENGQQKVDGEGVVQVGGVENGHQVVDGEGVVQAGGLENGHQMVDGEGVVQAGDLDNEHQMVDGEGVVQGDSFENGHQKVDGEGVMHAGGRLGNRKRKPSLVKRFNQEQTPCVTNYAPPDLTTKNTRSGGIVAQNRDQNSVYRSNDPACKSKTDDITDGSSITEIMKPISFASSESVPGILVTFMAKRSDGKEVMVDNKYLKANNPLLLINYYEQHLNYNATTGPPRPGGDSML